MRPDAKVRPDLQLWTWNWKHLGAFNTCKTNTIKFDLIFKNTFWNTLQELNNFLWIRDFSHFSYKKLGLSVWTFFLNNIVCKSLCLTRQKFLILSCIMVTWECLKPRPSCVDGDISCKCGRRLPISMVQWIQHHKFLKRIKHKIAT